MKTKTNYHRMKSLNARMVANYRRGIGPRRVVLLLTTIGRKSGQPRVTPLQFEEVDDLIYIASARGKEADWFKNIIANPNVHVQISDRQFDAGNRSGTHRRFSRVALASPPCDGTCDHAFV